MSKERELLKEPLELAEAMRKLLKLRGAAQFNEGLRVGQCEAKRMLLELEQVKQDYLNENERLTNSLLEAEDKIQELLAQPQKREPMTGKEISQGFQADKDATNAESYWAGVALAEKHHKIGGGE
jgi:signal transduction protein with GAF and PtsI domain